MTTELSPLAQLASENYGAWLDLQAQLVEYRIQHGISQTEVARRLGVSQPAISQLERIGNVPSLNSLLGYAQAIGARISWGITEPEYFSSIDYQVD